MNWMVTIDIRFVIVIAFLVILAVVYGLVKLFSAMSTWFRWL